MKINNSIMIFVGLFFVFIAVTGVQSQTLFNGLGHIPGYYQETWNVAGLLQDMSPRPGMSSWHVADI